MEKLIYLSFVEKIVQLKIYYHIEHWEYYSNFITYKRTDFTQFFNIRLLNIKKMQFFDIFFTNFIYLPNKKYYFCKTYAIMIINEANHSTHRKGIITKRTY